MNVSDEDVQDVARYFKYLAAFAIGVDAITFVAQAYQRQWAELLFTLGHGILSWIVLTDSIQFTKGLVGIVFGILERFEVKQ